MCCGIAIVHGWALREAVLYSSWEFNLTPPALHPPSHPPSLPPSTELNLACHSSCPPRHSLYWECSSRETLKIVLAMEWTASKTSRHILSSRQSTGTSSWKEKFPHHSSRLAREPMMLFILILNSLQEHQKVCVVVTMATSCWNCIWPGCVLYIYALPVLTQLVFNECILRSLTKISLECV